MKFRRSYIERVMDILEECRSELRISQIMLLCRLSHTVAIELVKLMVEKGLLEVRDSDEGTRKGKLYKMSIEGRNVMIDYMKLRMRIF